MTLEAITTRVQPVERIDVVLEDPTDDRILECALAAGAEAMISGDRHLLTIGTFRGMTIQRPADFLAGFQARGR
jgi:predicted nucleic acid-binding protein